jgi:hypothetical protein
MCPEIKDPFASIEMWSDIQKHDPLLYIWTHELIHAWIAEKYDAIRINIKVGVDGTRVQGCCTLSFPNKPSAIVIARVTAAPSIFFQGKTTDNYLINEREKARRILEAEMGPVSLGRFVELVVRPVSKLLPGNEQILHIARHYRERGEVEFPEGRVGIFSSRACFGKSPQLY